MIRGNRCHSWLRAFTCIGLLALCLVAGALHPANAQPLRIHGTINYTGALGPVSDARPLCLCFYVDQNLQLAVGCVILSSNGAPYQVAPGDRNDYFLIAFLDLNENERIDPNEPYEIFNDRAQPPADPVKAGRSSPNTDIVFGDENLPPVATPSPTATATAPPSPTPTAPACAGDCDGSREVTIDEIITLVNIALGSDGLDACQAGDRNRSASIEVDEIVAAVGSADLGCP